MHDTEESTIAPSIVGFGDIKSAPEAIDDWDVFLHDGEAFLRTGIAAHTKGKKAFTPEILYNIVAMAIEKFVMAALMQRGALPYNHTMRDLVESMEEVFPGAMGNLKEGLLDLDHYQEICDIDSYNIIPPAMEEIPKMLALAEGMQALVYETTGGKKG
jgi:hypothetical protein